MERYLLIAEKLYNELECGNITFEFAEAVGNLAYDKYVNESLLFFKKKESKKEITKPKTIDELAKRLQDKNSEVDSSLDKMNAKAKQFSAVSNKEKEKSGNSIVSGLHDVSKKTSSLPQKKTINPPIKLNFSH